MKRRKKNCLRPLTPEQSQLASINYGLVKDFLHLIYVYPDRFRDVRLAVNTLGHERSIDAATTALLSAVVSYAPDRGTTFRTYAFICMRNRLITQSLSPRLRFEASYQDLSLIPVDRIPKISLSNITETSDLVRTIISLFPGRHQEILKLRFQEGETFKSIAEKFNLTGARIQSIVSQCLERKKTRLSKFPEYLQLEEDPDKLVEFLKPAFKLRTPPPTLSALRPRPQRYRLKRSIHAEGIWEVLVDGILVGYSITTTHGGKGCPMFMQSDFGTLEQAFDAAINSRLSYKQRFPKY